MRLADLARTNRRPDVSLAAAITSGGQYLEAGVRHLSPLKLPS